MDSLLVVGIWSAPSDLSQQVKHTHQAKYGLLIDMDAWLLIQPFPNPLVSICTFTLSLAFNDQFDNMLILRCLIYPLSPSVISASRHLKYAAHCTDAVFVFEPFNYPIL